MCTCTFSVLSLPSWLSSNFLSSHNKHLASMVTCTMPPMTFSYIYFVWKASKEVMDLQPPQEETIAPREDEVEKDTLEAKIRKTRPPPRVRISSTSQPGFVSLRLEGVAVTFRNQEVIKDATWGVKTGDRIGLVGPNGEFGDSRITSIIGCGCFFCTRVALCLNLIADVRCGYRTFIRDISRSRRPDRPGWARS